MRWQTTAVLAVLLIALGVFYYVWEVRLGPEREKTEARKGRVFTVEPADVDEMVLRRGEETVRLKRAGEGWEILEPLKSAGDRGAVEEVVTSVATARMDREIDAKPQNLGDFGLDKPAAEATLVLKDGKQIALRLGAKSPTGTWVYAQEAGKPSVIVVSDGVLRDVTRPVADWRSKTVLAVDRKDVTGVDIVTRDETLALETSDNRWRLTRPRPLPADADSMREFFEKLSAARIKEFVAEAPRSLAPYGLDRPVRVAIHTGKDKDRATKALLLGRVDDKKKGVYAMRPGEPSVLLLPDDVWAALPKTTAAVRDKTVVDFERDKVVGLQLDSPRGQLTLTREGDRWKIVKPEALPADPVEAGAVLMRLKALRASAFLSDDASGIPRYLGRPEVRATLTLEGQTTPLTLLLAPSPDKRGGQPTAYAAVAGRGPVVLVEGSALTEIGRSLTDLRDRLLVSGLEPKDVKRLGLKSGDKTVMLERRSDTEWQFVEGGKGAVKTGKVDDVLWNLRGLKWKDLVGAPGQDLARYGLDAPAAEITLYRTDGAAITTLLVGKQDGNRRYVKSQAAPEVYAIDAKQLELPKIPDDF
jgi:Domain of unknown function (DUF4340)